MVGIDPGISRIERKRAYHWATAEGKNQQP